MDCSLPGSSIHGIFQAIVLQWVAISFSRGSSWPRDRTRVSHIVDRCFTVWATKEVLHVCVCVYIYIYLYLYLYNVWLRGVFVAVCRLSPVFKSEGHSLVGVLGLLLQWLLSLWSIGYTAHGLSCPMACGSIPDQGSNQCPLHCKADS